MCKDKKLRQAQRHGIIEECCFQASLQAYIVIMPRTTYAMMVAQTVVWELKQQLVIKTTPHRSVYINLYLSNSSVFALYTDGSKQSQVVNAK